MCKYSYMDGTHIPCVVVVSKPRTPWQVDCYVLLSMIHRHITRNQFKVPYSTASALANSQIDPIHARNICEAKMGKLSRTILEIGVIDFPKSQIRSESPSCTIYLAICINEKMNYKTRITRGINRNFKPYSYNFFFQSNININV